MHKAQLAVSALLLMLLLAACAPTAAPAPVPQEPAPQAAASAGVPAPAAPAKATWEVEWERTLASAKKENRVLVTGNITGLWRSAMVEGFKKAYGIALETVAGRGAETNAKVLAERRAGLYNYDVYCTGATTALTVMKPAGAIDPLDPALILPDVTDPEQIQKVWWSGKLWWVDADHTHLASSLLPVFPLAINTNLVKEGEIKSYRDLLQSKWQGKLALDDPTMAGIGNNFISFVDVELGWDYLVELVKTTKPIILRDQRQEVEWLAHGKIAVLVVPKVAVLTEFMQAGAPIKGLIPAEGTFLLGGSSNLSVFNKPAHPNATKVFINWYLSKEGQSITSAAAGYQSARLDVPADHLLPEQRRQPGVKYLVIEDEKLTLAGAGRQKKAQELFGPLMK